MSPLRLIVALGLVLLLCVGVLAVFAQPPNPPTNVHVPPNPNDRRTLSVTVSGSGSVTGPGLTPCTTSCSTTYVVGTTTSIFATPAAGSTFNGWSGACTGTGVCTVPMDVARSVTALFATVPGVLEATWTAPTTNTDGSPLIDLANYRVYYTPTPGAPCKGPTFVTLAAGSCTTCSTEITGLVNGTVYNADVTALNTSGIESACSAQSSLAAHPPGTITAASCSQADVQAAITSAPDGSTVMVPAGNCTWTSLTISGQAISLIGAGVGSTNITGSQILSVGTKTTGGSLPGFFRLSGFKFTTVPGGCGSLFGAAITIFGASQNVRVDHNSFIGNAACSLLTTSVQGVVDHNTFQMNAQVVPIYLMDLQGGTHGDESWAAPDNMGSAAAIYFEDNNFTLATGAYGTTDGQRGARIVYRHNTFTNMGVGNHGTESNQRDRSTRFLEVYENDFTVDAVDASGAGLAASRGGTGVIFNNRVHLRNGFTASLGLLNNMRRPGAVHNDHPWGMCGVFPATFTSSGGIATVTTTSAIWDFGGGSCANTQSACQIVVRGTSSYNNAGNPNAITAVISPTQAQFSVAGSPGSESGTVQQAYDGNTDSTGYPCIDQVGMGQSRVYTDRNLPGNDVTPVPILPANNVPSPLYCWNNTVESGGAPSTIGCFASFFSTDTIIEGRDFFNSTSTTIQKPGYTPFTYPHPLVGSAPPPGVQVNVASVLGPVDHNYSGYHLGFEGTVPIPAPDTVLSPLKPAFNDAPWTHTTYLRTVNFGATFYHEFGCCLMTSAYGVGGDWTAWQNVATTEANNIVNNGEKTGTRVKIYNEPDNPGAYNPFPGNAAANRDQFFEAWRRAVITARPIMGDCSVTPSNCVPIIGPTNAFSDSQIGGGQFSVREFLLYAQTNNVLPDILDWHENLNTASPYLQSEFVTRVANMRTWLVQNDNGSGKLAALANKITISEWGTFDATTAFMVPGLIYASLANLQRAGISGASSACWDNVNGSELGCQFSLDSAVQVTCCAPNAPVTLRAKWWAYKFYADLVGNYVSLTAQNGFDGMAAIGGSTARVILGNAGGNASVNLVLTNIASMTNLSSVNVTVQRIPATGFTAMPTCPSTQCPVVFSGQISVTNGFLVVPITGSQVGDGYVVTVN